jgi:hypothetical protein
MDNDDPPPAPDPVAVANAATASNKATAITQQNLNNVNQVTPYGNLNYTQSGKWEDGTPQYTATQTLSPEQQNLFNLSNQTQSNLGNIGVEQSNKVRGILNTPFDINSSINTQLADQQRTLLDPIWKGREEQQRAQLLNQGFAQNSENWNENMRGFNDERDRAYLTAALAGRGQATTEALTQRNQPLNEISALLSNSQVSQPNFVNTPQTNVAPVDVAGIQQAGYQNSLVPWQAQNERNNAMIGGIAGIAGSALGGWGRGGFSGAGKLFGIG